MGKARGVSRRRRKAGSFHYKRRNKLKQQRQRELRKCGPINCDLIRNAWDQKKSLRKNMKNMGLATDPNKLLNGPSFHEKFKNPNQTTDISNNIVLRLHARMKAKKLREMKKKNLKSTEFEIEPILKNDKDPKPCSMQSVAEKLTEMASQPTAKNFRFSPDQIKFCAYMIEKYDEDYEAMQRDKMNYYQESAGQIRAKIRKFLSIESHRNLYEKAKELCEQRLTATDQSS